MFPNNNSLDLLLHFKDIINCWAPLGKGIDSSAWRTTQKEEAVFTHRGCSFQ